MRVLLLDDSLTGWAGYNAGYDFAIQDALAQRGIQAIIFANVLAKDLSAVRPDGLRLTFRHYADLTRYQYELPQLPPRVRGVFYLLIGNWHHLKDLCRGVSPEVNSGDIVIATMHLPVTAFANSIWLLMQRLKSKRLTFLSVAHNVPSKFFGAEWCALRFLAHGHKIVLGAHTPDIAQLVHDRAGQPVYLLPLPFADRGNGPASENGPAEPGDTSTRPLHVTYLGMATYHKGYDLVVEALEALQDLIVAGQVVFIVQFNSFLYDQQNLAWKRRLEAHAATSVGLTLVEGALDNDAYADQILKADVVLVPNRAEHYIGALSGVFTEAVAIGKPVIVADGTNMAAELQKGVGAGVIFRNGDHKDLAHAIRKAVADYPVLRAQASAQADAWHERHSVTRYVDVLLNAAQGR